MPKKNLLVVGLSAILLSACTLPMSPKPSAEVAPVESTPIAETTAVDPGAKTYTLTAQNASGQNGTVTLTQSAENQTTVVIKLTGGDVSQPQPAHIHEGMCPTLGAVKFPLTDVVAGQSTTVLTTGLNDLLALAPDLAINVHASQAEIKAYTACGNLK